MILEIIIFIAFFFSVGGLIYDATGHFKSLYHDKLGWHHPGPNTPIMINGPYPTSYCEFCGKKIAQDLHGNWF